MRWKVRRFFLTLVLIQFVHVYLHKSPEIESLSIDVGLCEKDSDIVKATLHHSQMQSWRDRKERSYSQIGRSGGIVTTDTRSHSQSSFKGEQSRKLQFAAVCCNTNLPARCNTSGTGLITYRYICIYNDNDLIRKNWSSRDVIFAHLRVISVKTRQIL